MATFKTQIEDLTGSIGDDGALTQWLTDGAKQLINMMPPILKEKCMAETTINNSPTTMDLDGVGEIFHVTRLSADSGGVRLPCRKISSAYGELTGDSTSIHYASVTDPAYWISSSGDATLLSVNPTPTADQTAIVYHVAYPTPAHGDSVIANFPDELEYLVVLYASIKGLQRLQNDLLSNSDITTAFTATNTELDETQAICDLINTQVDSAVSELGEAATQVDSGIDTALAAITTASGRINTAVALANAEYDKCDAILDLGEADSEGDVNTALTAMNTELDKTAALCDGVLNAAIDSALDSIDLAANEAAEIATQTDNSGDFETALDAINTAVDHFRGTSDPALFGDENQYTSGMGMTHVQDALTNAKTIIDDGANSPTGNASGDAATYLYTEEDTELLNGALGIAQSEISRAQAHIAEWSASVQALQAEISGFATEVQSRAAFTGAKGQSVQSHIATANGYLQTAQGYAQEVQTKIAISNGYAQEVQARLSQVQSKISESNARIAAGNAYLQEASASAQEAQAYASEVNARVSQVGGYGQVVSGYLNAASGYASEIQSKLSIAQGYASEANIRMQRDNQKYQWYQGQQAKLQQDYNQGLQLSGIIQPQQQGAR